MFILYMLVQVLRGLEKELAAIIEKIDRHHPRAFVHKSRFSFFVNNKFKFSAMKASLTVPSGTPVSGFNNPVDVKGNDLPDSFYKPGTCVYGVIPVDGDVNPVGFSIAPGATEEDFVVTETVPGSASQGIITFDAQDADGNALPQSQGTLVFTAVAPKAVDSRFTFNQETH